MRKIFLPEIKQTIFNTSTLPSLSYVSEVCNEPNFFYAMHMHKNICELVYIREGKGNCIINNVAYSLSKGDLLVINEGILHQESSDPNFPLKTFVLGVNNLSLINEEPNHITSRNMPPFIKAGPHSNKIAYYMSNIFEECTKKSEGFDTLYQGILSALIVFIRRIIPNNNHVMEQDSDSLAFQVKDYIDQNYMNDIKLKDLASEFYVSSSHLAHTIKKELGFSPIKYIMDRRIGEAQKYLLSTDLSVTKISRLVGYENVNYFTNLFKKTVCFSPSKFRELYNMDKIK